MKTLIVVMTVAATSATLSAQAAPVPVVGQPIRVSAPSLGLDAVVFRFVAIRHDTLVVRAAGGDTTTRDLPLSLVTLVQVPGERHAHTAAGAVIGGIAGAVIGAELARPSNCGELGCQSYAAVAYAGVGLVAGAAVGGIIGHGLGPRPFVAVELRPSVHASASRERALSLGVALPF